MNFIGDIHGDTKWYFETIANLDYSIQLGDFGIGFVPVPERWKLNHKFIRGNHDNPHLAILHPNYLGDYGITYADGRKCLFVSGAASIDKDQRKSGVDWWSKEELGYSQANDLLDLCEAETNIEIVISHDCPKFVSGYYSFTGKLLDEVYQIVKPSLWIFGHYHTSKQTQINRTNFICVGINEVFTI